MKTELDNRLSNLLFQIEAGRGQMKVSFSTSDTLFQIWDEEEYIALNFWSVNCLPDIYESKDKLMADDYEEENKIQPETYQPFVDIIKLVK